MTSPAPHVVAIRTARAALGWTQGELATRSGVSVVTIARAESGMCSPRLRTVDKLLDTLAANGAVVVIGQPPGGYTLTVNRPIA